ncbi:hypothetical protein WN944_005519 [Citrus x changshan-huyou]|uniref:Uncharacterized protein n=1 Tax=Citrus x changshan-huyou TaxID=2935761 RepID=A0AAP0M533_9ROSI
MFRVLQKASFGFMNWSACFYDSRGTFSHAPSKKGNRKDENWGAEPLSLGLFDDLAKAQSLMYLISLSSVRKFTELKNGKNCSNITHERPDAKERRSKLEGMNNGYTVYHFEI